MTKEEIIEYVLKSPENTNANVLVGMLEQLDSGGGDYKKELLVDAEVTQITDNGNIYGTFDIPENIDQYLASFDYVLTIYNDNEFQYVVFENDLIYEIYDNDDDGEAIIVNIDLNKGFIDINEETYSGNIQIYKLVPTSSPSQSNDPGDLKPINDPVINPIGDGDK